MYGLLPDHAIEDLGPDVIRPYDPRRVQPCSYDVALDRHFLVPPPNLGYVDPARALSMIRVTPEAGFRLEPGTFALASTRETLALPANLAARVEGKSSLGRIGLAVHITAGWIDPGFHGQVTLELVNHGPRPIVLWPGMLIAQACFWRLESAARRPYGHVTGAHYQDQGGGPAASRAHDGFVSDSHSGESDPEPCLLFGCGMGGWHTAEAHDA